MTKKEEAQADQDDQGQRDDENERDEAGVATDDAPAEKDPAVEDDDQDSGHSHDYLMGIGSYEMLKIFCVAGTIVKTYIGLKYPIKHTKKYRERNQPINIFGYPV